MQPASQHRCCQRETQRKLSKRASATVTGLGEMDMRSILVAAGSSSMFDDLTALALSVRYHVSLFFMRFLALETRRNMERPIDTNVDQ